MSESIVDLRSDTVTRPTAEMRAVMAAAEVGDDQLEGDPTTRRLEERTAEVLGKEAALFFPSGIMSNQTALAVLGGPGDEIIVEAGAHVLHYEGAAASAIAGLQLNPVFTPDGRLTAERAQPAVRPHSRYLPRTVAVAVENTHLASGGTVMAEEDGRGIREMADQAGLFVHMDGARLWNACTASGRSPADVARPADTVMVCYSKGLGAPVGSALAGPADFMEEAWRVRRRLGGSMRQSGIVAAGALHALDRHRDRVAEDHQNAALLAASLAGTPGLDVVPPETNVVMIDLQPGSPDPEAVLAALRARGVLLTPFGGRRIRAVTHMDVDSAGVVRAADVLREVLGAAPEAAPRRPAPA
jgi:threonine aldolase